MNILVLRVSAIGDVIHTLPAIFLIKKLYPDAKVSWVVQKKAAALIENQTFIENLWILPDKFLHPKNWGQTIKIINQIKKTKWDAILDFQGIIKTTILSLFLKGKKYGFDYQNSRLGLTSIFTNNHTKPNYKNIIQKNMALASHMILHENNSPLTKSCPTIENLKSTFKLNFSHQKTDPVNNWLQNNQIEKYILISPNTTWPSKHWPEENWFKLIENLIENKNFVSKYSLILIGKDFGDQALNLSNKIQTKKLNIKICPKWDLLTTSYLISKTDLLIAPDTGILHIADFFGNKTIGIFGPTNAKKHGPFLTGENIKNAIQIECPHHYLKNHGDKSSINSKTGIQYNCMYKLSPEMLLAKISDILKI